MRDRPVFQIEAVLHKWKESENNSDCYLYRCGVMAFTFVDPAAYHLHPVFPRQKVHRYRPSQLLDGPSIAVDSTLALFVCA
jgi:hypothetical protein